MGTRFPIFCSKFDRTPLETIMGDQASKFGNKLMNMGTKSKAPTSEAAAPPPPPPRPSLSDRQTLQATNPDELRLQGTIREDPTSAPCPCGCSDSTKLPRELTPAEIKKMSHKQVNAHNAKVDAFNEKLKTTHFSEADWKKEDNP